MTLSLTIDTHFNFNLGLSDSDSNQVLAFYSSPQSNDHVEEMVPAIQKLLENQNLQPQNIENIIVNIGPSPFTGLRAGLAVAKGLRKSLEVEAIGVSCLDVEYLTALDSLSNTQNQTQIPLIIPLEDARRQMIYFKNIFESNSDYLSNQNFQIDTPENLISILIQTEILKKITPDHIILVGTGATKYQEFFQSHNFQVLSTFLTKPISCSKYVQVAETSKIENLNNQNLTPIYVKDPDIHLK